MDNSKSRVIKLEGEKKKVTGQYPIQIVSNQQQKKRKNMFLNNSQVQQLKFLINLGEKKKKVVDSFRKLPPNRINTFMNNTVRDIIFFGFSQAENRDYKE